MSKNIKWRDLIIWSFVHASNIVFIIGNLHYLQNVLILIV